MGSKLQKRAIETTDQAPSGRGLAFWVIWMVYAWITLIGWERLYKGIADFYWLNLAGITPGPVYIAITGGLWGLVGLVVVAWMALGRPGYRQAGFGAALLFALTYWADRMLFTQPSGNQYNMGFAALLTLVSLFYAFMVLRPYTANPAKRAAEAKQAESSQRL